MELKLWVLIVFLSMSVTTINAQLLPCIRLPILGIPIFCRSPPPPPRSPPPPSPSPPPPSPPPPPTLPPPPTSPPPPPRSLICSILPLPLLCPTPRAPPSTSA
ncbi:hypothetical protein MIMGU_mgv11b014163mg [Erythranthe guttata]|uniref:Uncharacterized protein n=1 Tax=Erythranthe guttata TaxID=4155 RepID=A0A022RDT6_ERYGU|nr:hypothetical protein MIMGU_mgv11b014163mg [Erythranthe guttata]